MSFRSSRSAASIVYLLSLGLASTLCAQVAPRIVGIPDNHVLVRLPGTTHPLVSVAREIGRAPGNLPMTRVLLQLTNTPEQAAALDQLLSDQQDTTSPRYHAWLTPEQFGEQFGAAPEDIAAITGWLESHGFQVTEVSAGRRSIEFSGTAQQIETAFHTQINRYEWGGKEHIANATDISIPAALAPVVAGVASLHNFGPRPLHHVISPKPAPLTDFNGGTRGISPYDFAAIYDVAPLWTAGYDGTGTSVAIVGESDIAMSDVTGFRATFGLPVNNPTFIVNGADPGTVPGDQTESTLDVEWAGAVAKGATIKFVTSASTNSSDGVTLSAQYIVQHNTAPVMSLSYGLCEAYMGSGNSFYSSLWQQAAAEGIAVFVASGDNGSAGCDVPSSTNSSGANNTAPASQGFGINGLASSPYNVAVGGTEFNDTASPSTYWNTSNNSQLASAKGYIPEKAWNESSYTAGATTNSLYAGGGGTSTVFSRPSWQTAPGVPSGSMRLTPDVALTAAGHDGYVIELQGGLYLVGGTSASTPSFAGLMAIVNQYTHTINGSPNSKFYAMASSVPSVYHDVTTGSNAVPCAGGSANCSTSAPTTNVGNMTGYSAWRWGFDMATGLGSVDANALVTNWGSTSTAPAIVALSPNPITGSASAQTLTINGSGFVAGSGLTVTVGTVTYQGSAVTFVSSSQLTVSVNVGTAAQSLPVKVTFPAGTTTNSVTLAVTAPVVAPAITSVSPNPMTESNSVQTLTVFGSGFVLGTGLKVTVGSTVYQGSQVAFVASTQLTVSVNVGASVQSLAVQVTNPNGQTSNSVNLAVTAPPAITTLSPNPMTGSTAVQTLTVNGSGFVSGSGLKVTVGTFIYQGSQVAFVSSSQLTVAATVGATVQSLPVLVTNPNGAASNSVNLSVIATAAPPVITTLSPNPIAASSAVQTLAVNGSRFVSGSGLRVTVGSTAYQGSQVVFVSSSLLSVAVNAGNTARSLQVQVTNPSGQISNSVNLSVSAPPAAPAITTLSPNPFTALSAAQTLTVNGSGFVSGSALKVTVGSTAYQAPAVTFLSSSQLSVAVSIGTAAQSLPVQVTNPSGQTSNSVNLSVSAPPAAPAITTLSPNPMIGSSMVQPLTINGSGFVAGSGLKVTVGSTAYQGSQVAFVSSSQLTVAVNVGISAQSLAVQVTNPNGQASKSLSLAVTPPAAPVIGTLNPNPMTGSNSPQTLTINGSGFQSGLRLLIGGIAITSNELPLLTPTELQLSIITGVATYTLTVQVVNPNGGSSNTVNFQVNAPPAITSVTPNPLTHSTASQVLTVNGTNFQSGAGLKVTVGATSYSGSQVTFVSATQLRVTVTVTSAATAPLAVQVTNPNGGISNSAALTVK